MSGKYEYLKPITLSPLVWSYVERRGLRIVVEHPNNTQQFVITWKRLDRLRKQVDRDLTAGKPARGR